MPDTKGSRVYWRPSVSGAAPVQILKNSGYVSVTLQAVQYKSSGNWWQHYFKGSDKITVSTQVTWQNGADPKTAAAVQDFRKIAVPSVNALAIGRNVVLKVPASADGIELQVSIHAVHDDNLGKTLQMLNSEEFKQPLQLAPVAVGQALSIANMVKKTFTDVEDDALTATYPGIISAGQMPDPVAASRLVQGYIIIVVKQDDDDELDFDPAQLTVNGNRVLLDGEPLGNTYMVYNVTYDVWKGADPTSAWARKFADASSKADDLIFAPADQRQSIISSAHDLLMQGKGLLDADDTFRAEEKSVLAKAAFQAVADKIGANAGPSPQAMRRGAGRDATLVLPAELDLSPEDRSAVRAYAWDLSRAGLPLGLTLNAAHEETTDGVAAIPLPLAMRAAAASCAAQVFSGITNEKWLCLMQRAAQNGIDINGPDGQASRSGVTIGWHYDGSTQQLTLSCLSKPALLPCSFINTQLHSLVDGCAGN